MKKILYIYVSFPALFLLYWVIYAVAPDFHAAQMQGEDRIVEWITFFGFLGASLTAFYTLRFVKKMKRTALAYILMTGFLFFVCAGEEISWGQRLFGFETPENMVEMNEQGEFNLHNLNFKHIHPSDLISWYMKIFGIVLPLLLLWSMRRKDSAFRRYISAPELIPCFCFPEVLHLMWKTTSSVTSRLIRPEAAHVVEYQNEELLEMYWGLCVFLTMLFIYSAWKRYHVPGKIRKTA